LMYDLNPRWNKREQDRHLWEPFLHKITNGVFAIRTLERLSFFRSSRYPEVIGDRAAAHMSLHLKPTMSKSRRASSPGSYGSGHRLYRPRRGTKRTRDLVARPRPLLEGHIWVAPSAVNRVFCNLIAVRRTMRPKPLSSARLSQTMNGALLKVIKASKYLS